jgi:hypothetical protein
MSYLTKIPTTPELAIHDDEAALLAKILTGQVLSGGNHDLVSGPWTATGSPATGTHRGVKLKVVGGTALVGAAEFWYLADGEEVDLPGVHEDNGEDFLTVSGSGTLYYIYLD